MRRSFPGVIHGFIEMAGALRVSLDAFETIAFFLKQCLNTNRSRRFGRSVTAFEQILTAHGSEHADRALGMSLDLACK
jgi:hypothetical protein